MKGVVYKVDPEKYGPDGYSCFAGRDVSRNLAKSIISDSEANADWNVRDDNLSAEHRDALESWSRYFEQKYPVMGRIELAGREAALFKKRGESFEP